ncbi:lipopolysaccharide transport periplasmic protein LptA [Campylobacter sp. RM12920]|uniref:Lipopolysaccharide transport periplasmic protein LptA n=1 Tax=Campylobacter californiensis TaxID=1032243 RepID=A0ABD4JK57_9BACT|nr:lipopolysaccharide transport periplasmic protein LptA [Campylobacter sp. RM12919]MBE2987792.1 lipopolysaccharide transport periplasmic protein LptA [Campylobacter sp. RM12920]
MDRARAGLILGLILSFTSLSAEQVEITSDSFFADENKQRSEFKGNVHIKKGSYDELFADKVVVHFDAKRQPTKYIATGNAKFKVFMKEKHYNGKGETLTYEPVKEIYTISGNGHLHEQESDKNVYGEKITINQTQGTYNVNSNDNKPVKFIFQIEDKQK